MSLALRKLSTTLVTTTVFSLLLAMAFSLVDGFEFEYNKGYQLMGLFFFYFLYVGIIIFVYGNLVSIVIERLQAKWFPVHNWLYVFILGVFGLVSGLIFPSISFALLGSLAAILYGIIDKSIEKRVTKNKSIKIFFLIPIASLLLCWGIFQVTSPPQPPFTIEDVVHFATSGEGTEIDLFPKTIGNWEGHIDGYEVTRETSAKEIGEEIYVVSFTESWKKGNENGTRTLSYKVERGRLEFHSEQGGPAPY